MNINSVGNVYSDTNHQHQMEATEAAMETLEKEHDALPADKHYDSQRAALRGRLDQMEAARMAHADAHLEQKENARNAERKALSDRPTNPRRNVEDDNDSR